MPQISPLSWLFIPFFFFFFMFIYFVSVWWYFIPFLSNEFFFGDGFGPSSSFVVWGW